MKLNDVEFYGFTRNELNDIRSKTGRTGEEDFTMDFSQAVAELFESDVVTVIRPGGRVSIVKAGE